jgi:formylglycine-generating enzyme required for sulfatase activity
MRLNHSHSLTEEILVPAGELVMGREDGPEEEVPRHRVVLDAYWIDRHPVTNASYALFCRETGHPLPDYTLAPDLKDPKLPVTMVSWFDAKSYAAWCGKRLPTEAQWEKAARGGLEGKQPLNAKGESRDILEVLPIEHFPPNAWGIFDMGSNVWEWVDDWYEKDYYRVSPHQNPLGPESGVYKVIRGGDWVAFCFRRLTNRGLLIPSNDRNLVGFRLCRPL